MNTRLSLRWILPPLMLAAVLFLASCSEDKSPVDYQTHPDGWNNFSSVEFHGSAALKNNGAGCTGCHGGTFRGQGDAVSCYECHGVLHVDVRATMPITHQQYITSFTWDLAHCAKCHGSDYAGGTSGVSCNSCHAGTGGPAACGTCHALPPVNDDGLPYGMLSGAAGGHAVHARFGCDECHSAVSGLAHVDALPADITFANARVARLHNFSPVFTHLGGAKSGNGSCATVYCHSDGSGGPPAVMPQWTVGGINCLACHGLPPSNHDPSSTNCHECHTNVDPASDYTSNDNIRFLVDSLHVNGVINF